MSSLMPKAAKVQPKLWSAAGGSKDLYQALYPTRNARDVLHLATGQVLRYQTQSQPLLRD